MEAATAAHVSKRVVSLPLHNLSLTLPRVNACFSQSSSVALHDGGLLTLLLLFKALLHGQKDHFFFSGHLIYIPKQERFTAFRTAQDI
jgi:hypothetical protein